VSVRKEITEKRLMNKAKLAKTAEISSATITRLEIGFTS
jgi:DNA-binding XRE family transcriptional regulator